MANFWGKRDNLAEEQNLVSNASNSSGTGVIGSNLDPNKAASSPSPFGASGARSVVKSAQENTDTFSGIEHFIGIGTKLKANVHFPSGALIDGEFEGDVYCSGTLIIGASGEVLGPVHCAGLVVHGKYKGLAKVEKLTSIKAGGSFAGSLESGIFSAEEGAVINGDVKITINSGAGP